MASEASHAVPTSISVLGSFLVLFGLYSRRIKEYYLTETLLSTLFGIILGSGVLGILDFISSQWDEARESDLGILVLTWTVRTVVSVQILFAACTLPSRYLLRRDAAQSILVLLGPVMIIAWLVSSGLVKACIPSLAWADCFLIGATVTPTDPVLASSVVKGHYAEQHVPRHLRDLLLMESAINDGMALPFVMIPLLLIKHNHDVSTAMRHWFLDVVLFEVVGSCLLGAAIGTIVRKALQSARRHKTVDRESLLVLSLAVAMVCLGVADLVGVSEFLTCFSAGTALNWTDSLRHDDLKTHFSEGVEMLADSSVFILIGTILPWETWSKADYVTVPRLVLLGLSIMLLRRIPAVLAFSRLTPQLKTFKESLFVGHYGGIATGALYFALSSATQLPTDLETRTVVIPVVSFIIFTSIIVHGSSAPLSLLASQIPHRYVRQILKAEEAGAADELEEEPTEGSPLLEGGNVPALVPGRVARELADESRGAIARRRLDTILHKGQRRKHRHAQADGEGQADDGDDEEGDDDERQPYGAMETKKERDKKDEERRRREQESGGAGQPRRRSPSPALSDADSLHELLLYDEGDHVVIVRSSRTL